MDIKAAVARLASRDVNVAGSSFAMEQPVRQFNALLAAAKERFPDAVDVTALHDFGSASVQASILTDSIGRLAEALGAFADDAPDDRPALDHKFGTLRAERQLAIDFETYVAEKAPAGILFFDIDHFKRLNEAYTETVVDREILKPFHLHLASVVDARGFAYSVGGDEFMILLRNSDAEEAAAFATRLLRVTAEHNFSVAGKPLTLTLSIGVASYPADSTSLDELRELANRAENEAKKQGRNRIITAQSLNCPARLDSA